MAYTPATIVKLCSVPFDSSGKHQLLFADAGSQATYFAGKAVKAYTAFDYQRRDNVLFIPDHIDVIAGCNYVMYNNANFTNKWFYAFIEKMEWRSNQSTGVYLKTDVFQTWFLDCTFKQSFVEREHVTDDSIGLHIQPENLELGDYIPRGETDYNRAFMGDLGLMAAVTEYWNGSAWATATGNVYNGIFSGCKLYSSTSAGNMAAFLDKYVDDGKKDSVIALWMLPKLFLGSWNSVVTAVSGSESCEMLNIEVPDLPENIDGYVPKNNKLFTFPYNLFVVHNNAGNMAVFKYEDFDGQPTFNIYGGIMPTPIYKAFPANLKNSNGAGNGLEYGLTISGYPICAWSSDTFKNWLAQNSIPIAGNLAAGAVGVAAGAVTGNVLAIGGGVLAISQQLQQIYQKSIIPDQVNGSLNAGSANNAKNWNDFYFVPKYIKAEFAEVIDDYFSMFGYKVNMVKVPALTSRPVWNYVKTIDANITGAIPADDMLELKKLFDSGITLWHSASGIYDYTADNSIVEP